MMSITNSSGTISKLQSSAGGKNSYRAGTAFFLGAVLVFCVIILFSRYAPLSMDYPDWVYQGVLFADWMAGHAVPGYVFKHYPVPNTTSTLGLGLLTLTFGWDMAARLWLVLTLAISAAVSLYAGRVFAVRETALWGVLPSALLFGQIFWLGTANFNLGLALFLLLASLLYQRKERPTVILGLLLVCFFTHLILYAAVVLLIWFYCLQHRRWQLIYLVVATMPLPLWYFAGRILTHSPESHVAASPLSHVAAPVVVALLLLLASLFLRNWPVVRAANFLLVPVAILLPLAALLTGLRRGPPSSAVNLLQLKALVPFQLLGFTDILTVSPAGELLSSTFALLGRHFFVALIMLDLLAGVFLFGAIIQRLRASSRAFDDPAFFLWNFIALFTLIFFVCPPNALGVFSIDLRLAQLFLTPALFLLARKPSPALRLAVLPLTVLLLVNAWQFALLQNLGSLPSAIATLPARWVNFGRADPTTRAHVYEHLQRGQMTEEIFPTALFLRQTP